MTTAADAGVVPASSPGLVGPDDPGDLVAVTAAHSPRRRTSPQTRERMPNRTDLALVGWFTVLLVLTSRFGVPVGDTSISIGIPLAYVFAVVMVWRGTLAVDRLRAELFVAALTATLAVTVVTAVSGRAFSMTSFLLLVAVYLPWVLGVGGRAGRMLVERAGRAFVGTVLVLSGLGIAQFGGQVLGLWSYRDYLAQWVPTTWLVPNYHTDNPLSYGSAVYKANAFVLLEPSFLSQYAALAILIGLVLGLRSWKLVLLLAGLGSAVSGTGVLLLAAGGVMVLVRAPRLLRTGHFVAGAVGVAVILVSPVASSLLSRRSELSEPGSSGYARFVSPYREVLRGLTDDSWRYAFGAGPGMTERLLASGRFSGGDDVLYGVVPKLLFEYGLLAGGIVIAFLVLSTLDGSPWKVVPGALLVMVFVLSGALLQPQTAYLVWVLSGIGAGDVRRRRLVRHHRGRAVGTSVQAAA